MNKVICSECGQEHFANNAEDDGWLVGIENRCPDHITGFARAKNQKIVIVSRHAGLLEWLRNHGISGPVVTGNATIEDVAGKDVFGILPLWLAAHANSVTEVSMPDLPLEFRGKEYTPEQMDLWGAHLNTFYVRTPDKFLTTAYSWVNGCMFVYGDGHKELSDERK